MHTANQRSGTTMSTKIFILGDSRTGTTTLHKFMKIAGFRSIHYFFEESGVHEPAHEDYENNWKKMKEFIDNSGFDVFSDYPLRTFYKDLFETYPDSIFILSVRKDVETWKKSMIGYFSKRHIELDVDIDTLARSYYEANEEIRRIAKETRAKFCEICIDDSSEENGGRLSEFLELKTPLQLGWENKTEAYDNKLWSKRVSVFNTSSENVLDYVKRSSFPSKAMLSEHGWVYLINDGSEFMDCAFGDVGWDPSIVSRACTVLAKRRDLLNAKGSEYMKIVVPEKATIYPEFLPKIFKGAQPKADRPANQIASRGLDSFLFLEETLKDAKSLGQLYFRGDSHTNWFGAYFVYHAIISRMNEILKKNRCVKKSPLPLSELQPFLKAYGGDLYTQLDDEMKSYFGRAWKSLNLGDELEYTVGLKISDHVRTARPAHVEPEIADKIMGRETFRFVNDDQSLPKAVIFRDSTSQFIVDLLAEHFSSSLFIWHKGLVYEDIIEREKPDIVLHIMAERFLSEL